MKRCFNCGQERIDQEFWKSQNICKGCWTAKYRPHTEKCRRCETRKSYKEGMCRYCYAEIRMDVGLEYHL